MSILENWQTSSLGEFVTFQRGFDITKDHQTPGSYKVYSSSGPASTNTEYKVKGPGVIIGRKGTLGTVFFSADDFWPHDTTLWVKDFHKNDELFVYYLLKCLPLSNYDAGASNPSLNRNHVHLITITYPSLLIQRKIAAILSAYDDLIENNTRRIALLEQMAQAIYREWFVEYRFPGHEQTHMVPSALGNVPEGWRLQRVSDLLNYHIGGGWGQDSQNSDFPIAAYVIRGTDIPDALHIQLDKVPLRFHKESNFKPRQLKEGDIVFEVSGGSKGQPVGRALLIYDEHLAKLANKVICASFCKLLRVATNLIAPEIFYCHLLEIYKNKHIEKYQVQSTGITNFKFQQFLDNEFLVVSPRMCQEQFNTVINPLFTEINFLGSQNANLRRTRDLLLPKLISGEIDVSAMEITTGKED